MIVHERLVPVGVEELTIIPVGAVWFVEKHGYEALNLCSEGYDMPLGYWQVVILF